MKKEVRMIRTDDVAAVTPYQSAVKGYRARRLVTKEKVNSEKLMVGIVEIEPNAKGYRWSYTEAEGNDEVYYVLQGKVRLYYDDRSLDAEKGDAIFLPAGREYRLDNRLSRPARLIYALSPPIE
jgi:mannose-6-phosphate isomerase-like protein (cupin superfamily)